VGGASRLFFLPDVEKQTSLFGEAKYRLSETTQIGASGAVRAQGNGDNMEIALQLLFGPTFNFGIGAEGIRNAFFFSPKAGVTAYRVSSSGSVLKSGAAATLAMIAGKRFAFGKHFAFAPSLGAVREIGRSTAFTITPLAFAFFF
jgi:hypothetical protein